MNAPTEDSFATSPPFPAAPERRCGICSDPGVIERVDLCQRCDGEVAHLIVAGAPVQAPGDRRMLELWKRRAQHYLEKALSSASLDARDIATDAFVTAARNVELYARAAGTHERL